MDFLAKLSSVENEHMITYFGHTIERVDSNTNIFWMLMELGPKGTLWDLLASKMTAKTRFTEDQVLNIALILARSLVFIHENDFIHCDFKVENILYFSENSFKLCDFGSVNQFDIDFKTTPRDQIYKLEEIFEKQVTPMYRPPEMCDPYLGYRVNAKADVWMLGCVLFTILFFKHPFTEWSKLSISSAAYKYPVENDYSEDMEILVRNFLTPNPEFRPDSNTARVWIEKLIKKRKSGETKNILQLNAMSLKISQEHSAKNHIMQTGRYRKYSPDFAAKGKRQSGLRGNDRFLKPKAKKNTG